MLTLFILKGYACPVYFEGLCLSRLFRKGTLVRFISKGYAYPVHSKKLLILSF